ncbi:hypothetical protein EDC82_1400 [Dermacoccus sp. SAI-028]|uniref:hypothetical protein n=1 Tax=unclassified Dermacoccus TaxID=2643059 RepID=UPI001051D8EB|nr:MULTISPECIES: hypothetical protein [unclassified Dermacoccus]MBO1757166.1 hypothetical protein [Dermacoccus sp. NHGro5]TCJ91641.1 hypothetical protein EDC82_1400 [Dermacoccus sp. SAI-028]
MSDVDKAQVLKDLVAHLSERLDQADEAVRLRQQVGEVIEQDEHRVDDVSHQEDAGDMHDTLQEVDKTQQRIVETAKALTTACDVVKPGAVISFGGEHFVVGVATDEFTSGGTTYLGISPDAPIYAAIEGKRAEDTFEFNGTMLTLDDVS